LLVIGNIISYLALEIKQIKVIRENLVAISISLGIVLIGAVVAGYIATKTDTEDPVIYEQLECQKNGMRFDDS
jgi:hypothetical protein